MEGVASEVSLKIRSAIKAKLVELGTYVDEELPDYIMVLVANKKTKDQMDDDLSLFLGHNTERFTSWLHHVLQKLNAAALLQSSGPSADAGKNKATAAQEEAKRKELEDEKRREKEEEKRKEREEEKKRLKQEEAKKTKEEEKRKSKEKEKTERKRKSSERKGEKDSKKEKKLKKSESPTSSPEKNTKEKRQLVSEVVKPIKMKESPKEEKAKPPPPLQAPTQKEEPSTIEKTQEPSVSVAPKKMKPLVRGKISSADIFRAESQAEQKKEEEEDGLEDLLVLRADDDLGLELEEEPTLKKNKPESIQRTVQLRTEVKEESKPEPKITLKTETKEKADLRERTVSREKSDHRDKSKSKADPPAPRISAKNRLGGIIAPRSSTSRDKVSILDRLGSSTSGKHILNLREESSVSSRSESTSSPHTQAVARVVSSAITSAQRSVCVLPPSNSSGKKLEARVRPLMSRQIESSHVSVSRGVSGHESSSRSEERVRESVCRPSGRVVSAVGAVLKRPHSQSDSDDEEYDPKKPGLSGIASKVEVTPRPRRPRAIQANTALILRAMADAHKSVNRPSRRSKEKEKEKEEKHKSRKKHKGELFSRSYRKREEAAREKKRSESPPEIEERITIRKIAITVPNATHKESEKQHKKLKKELRQMEEDEEEDVEVDVSIAMRPHLPPVHETRVEIPKKEAKEELMDTNEARKMQTPDDEYRMEEVEEVMEEVVDEGIEEDQPPIRQAMPPLVGSGESTKFIVTLEGMDSEEYPEKPEPLSIRSRLGMRPPSADTEEQVEEYIEEVEEWEEEEELPDEFAVTSGLGVGGVLTGVKSRLKAATTTTSITNTTTTPVTSLQPGSTKERCKYWPLCKAGEACIYHHPTLTCKSFPGCKFGDKCLFIHPNCLYDGACTRLGCPFTHASSRNFAMVSATSAPKHKAVAPTKTSNIKCKFFPMCTNLSCPFLHPKACYYGTSCKQQPNCPFTHPAVPMGAKLKWVAPKTSAPLSTASSTTSTTFTATTTTPAPVIKESVKVAESLIIK